MSASPKKTREPASVQASGRASRLGVDMLPPFSEEAERAVLGCCLANSREFVPLLIQTLKGARAFYDLRHQAIANLMVSMFDEGELIDMTTVAARSFAADKARDVGGLGYLTELYSDALPPHFERYLGIVRERMLLREALRVCVDFQDRIMGNPEDPMGCLDQLEQAVMAVNQGRATQGDTIWKEAMGIALDQLETYHRGGAQMQGLPTGFTYLDKMLCGMIPEQMIVIAGRPGTGKTSLAFNVVETLAVDRKIPVGIFSLEMSGPQLAKKALFAKARADYQRFRTGYLKDEDVPRLLAAAGPVASAPIFLHEHSGTGILEIRAKARRWVNEHKIQLIVIDYLGLVLGTGHYRDRKDEVGEVSRQTKAMAKELKVPVIMLAQLNRELEKDKSRVPQLSDLRDSGDIEQDADVVAILYRPKLNKAEQEAADNRRDWAQHSDRINLQICKQREGPTGKVELLFEKACMRFSSFKRAKQQEEQEEL